MGISPHTGDQSRDRMARTCAPDTPTHEPTPGMARMGGWVGGWEGLAWSLAQHYATSGSSLRFFDAGPHNSVHPSNHCISSMYLSLASTCIVHNKVSSYGIECLSF